MKGRIGKRGVNKRMRAEKCFGRDGRGSGGTSRRLGERWYGGRED